MQASPKKGSSSQARSLDEKLALFPLLIRACSCTAVDELVGTALPLDHSPHTIQGAYCSGNMPSLISASFDDAIFNSPSAAGFIELTIWLANGEHHCAKHTVAKPVDGFAQWSTVVAWNGSRKRVNGASDYHRRPSLLLG